MLEQLNASLLLIIQQTRTNAGILAIMMAVVWGIFFLSCLDKRLLYFGIIPRHIMGVPGILLAPLLHANVDHVFFNSIPLLILGNFLLIHGLDYFLLVTLLITFISGVFIWCFAKSGLYIGASSVITGYWSLLVLNSYQERTITAFILGFISLYYFAGIFYGLFPSKKGVSWQGHVFGLVAGLLTGFLITTVL